MKNRNLVAITLDLEAAVDWRLEKRGISADNDEEEIQICEYLPKSSELKKIPDYLPKFAKLSNTELIQQFFNTSLPFMNHGDINPFDLFDADCQTFQHRSYRITDSLLERDVEVPSDIGLRFRRIQIDSKDDHFYLPGLPNLVYEEYPYFKPDVRGSQELTNNHVYEQYVKPFDKVWKQAQTASKPSNQQLGNLRDIILYQTPVSHTNYFSFSIYEFADVFQNKIFEPLTTIFSELLYTPDTLKEFFRKDEARAEYSPILSTDCYVSLKPIGSCAESPYAFGIKDEETGLLNMLFAHVEFANLCLALGEGYELYFQTKKRNFQGEHKVTGSDRTKIDNFLKRFSKCVAICVNSKTNKFILTDYYWTGLFEIEHCLDGEIEDVNKFISQVQVRHFGFYNFEKDRHLTVRNIIGSFLYTTPKQHKSTIKKFDKINNRISKEWESFLENKTDFISSISSTKKINPSSFIFRTLDGMAFTAQKVDLVNSLISFTAIGVQWSCQTLLVDLQKLYVDPNYKPKNAEIIRSSPHRRSPVLLSVYDEYYQDPSLSMLSRHLRNHNLKYGSTKSIENAEQVYMRWLSNLDSYNKLNELQGEVIAKVLDYGYLEDISRNNNCPGTHFKTDGYYIVYEPICNPEEEQLIDLNPNSEEDYQLALSALSKLHLAGVSFAPTSTLIPEIFKIYNKKAYIINLEDTNSMVVQVNHIKKDIQGLDRFFNRKTDIAQHLKIHNHPMADQYIQDAENKQTSSSTFKKRRRSSSHELIQGLNSLVAESRRRLSRSRSRRGSAVDAEALRGLAGRMNEGDFLVIESDDEEY